MVMPHLSYMHMQKEKEEGEEKGNREENDQERRGGRGINERKDERKSSIFLL